MKRNPNIAYLFYVMGLIEHWGRGTQKIVDLSLRAGLAEPQFQQYGGNGFAVVFPAPVATKRMFEGERDASLTDRQREVLSSVNRQRKVTLQALTEMLPELTERIVRQDLESLRKRGVVKSQGHGRGAFWVGTSKK